MSDLRRLFIVTDDGIHLGRASRHKELAEKSGIEERRITFGGGAHEQKDSHFILFGESYDYGRFASDIVKMHIENKAVYWFKHKYEDFTLEIDESREEKESDKF
jgi:hypothetical protein